jgi:DNA uptake protein ComE-like DNA-binding protein
MDSSDYIRLRAFIRIDSVQGNSPPLVRRDPVRFELNAADSSQLLSVRGIGPVFARRIIRYRELLGGFHAGMQLMEVYGLKPSQYDELMKQCYIDTGMVERLNLNTEPVSAFSAHPYIDPYQAAALVRYRELEGFYMNVNETVNNLLLPDTVYRKVRPYLIAGPPSRASQGLQDF